MKLKFTRKTWYFFLLAAAAMSMLGGFAVLGGMDFSGLELIVFCITGIAVLFLAAQKGAPAKDKRSYTLVFVLLMLSKLAAGGEEQVVDYLCPQIYWGYGYTLQSGSTRFAFENIVPAWLAYPRAEGMALYFGLGAYRVGTGDGGANPDSVSGWSTGDVLARQVQDLRSQNAGGWALYRYGSLFGAGAPEQAAAECAALRAVTGKET